MVGDHLGSPGVVDSLFSKDVILFCPLRFLVFFGTITQTYLRGPTLLTFFIYSGEERGPYSNVIWGREVPFYLNGKIYCCRFFSNICNMSSALDNISVYDHTTVKSLDLV